MQDFLTQPPEDAVQTIQSVKYVTIDYSAMKTPATFAKSVNDEFMQDAQMNCKLGFHYYDKNSQKRLPLRPFTFFVLEVYSGLTGAEKDASTGEFQNYWSNRVKDTRTQPYTLYVNGSKTEHSGLWNDIYDTVVAKYGKGVRNVRCLVCYCKELDTLIEIPLTATAERGIKKAIANSQPQKKVDWKKVSLYGLADNDHIWGFQLTGFEKENDKGEAYTGGDMFFSPSFHCGILQPMGAGIEIHAKCVEYQNEVRAVYAARGERLKKAEEEAPLAAPTTPDPNFPTYDLTDYADTQPEPGIDLPF